VVVHERLSVREHVYFPLIHQPTSAIHSVESGMDPDGPKGGGRVFWMNGDEPVGEYSFSGQSCLSSADS